MNYRFDESRARVYSRQGDRVSRNYWIIPNHRLFVSFWLILLGWKVRTRNGRLHHIALRHRLLKVDPRSRLASPRIIRKRTLGFMRGGPRL